ncbi:hypothetical protein LTS10_000895 [Elasticomyces elasticus]|nr:hypothetical protein LTS10_000895 [Elasticomyces elasticus]
MASPAFSARDTPSNRKRRRCSGSYDELYDRSVQGSLSTSERGGRSDTDTDRSSPQVDEEPTDITLPEHNNARAPAFEVEFSLIEPALRKPAATLPAMMAKHGKLNAVVKSLLLGVQDLLTIKKPQLNATLRGETGSGKSGLFNSIADVAGLVKSLNAGRRGSHAPTVGQGPFVGQTMRFGAKVVFSGYGTSAKLLADGVRDYYAWRHPASDETADERRQNERKGRTAFHALMCLCSNKEQFFDAARAHDWLEEKRGSVGNLLANLRLWCAEALPETTAEGSVRVSNVLMQANTVEDLHELLRPYSDDTPSDRRPALWPLVDRVRIGIEGRAIFQYFELIDSTGSGDSDLLRSRAHERLYDDCHEVWITHPIGRIATDQVVGDMLRDCCLAGRTPVVVATHAEEKTAGLVSIRYEGQDVCRLEICLETVRRLETKKGVLEQQLRKHSREQHRQQRLQSDMKDVKDSLVAARQERLEVLVDARNGSVAEGLDNEYGRYLEHLPGDNNFGKLRTFCVANEHYAHGRSGDEDVQPLLPLASTGVPDLRKHVWDQIAASLLQALQEHIETVYEPYVTRLRAFVNPMTLRGREEALAAVEAATIDIDVLFRQQHQLLDALIKDNLSRPLLTEVERRMYRTSALSVLEQKRNNKALYPTGTLKAFIKKKGAHQPTRKTHESWNKELSLPATLAVIKNLKPIETTHKQLMDSLETSLQEAIKGISRRIEAGVLSPADLKRFNDRTRGEARAATKCCSTYRNAINDGFRAMQVRLNEPDRSDNYFYQAMDPAWEACLRSSSLPTEGCLRKNSANSVIGILGSLSPTDALAELATHLRRRNDNSPFVTMIHDIEKDMLAIVQKPLNTLAEHVRHIMDGIRGQVGKKLLEDSSQGGEVALRADLKPILLEMEQAASESKSALERLVQKHRVPEAVMI